MSIGAYQKNQLRAGWTRVDLILELYDRTITAINSCIHAESTGNQSALTQALLDANKSLLAIQTGLKPEENEVAFNIARLLHFVIASMEKKDFESALRILGNIREGFAAVADELNEMERAGEIPPIPDGDTFQA